ncbi:hypothetical protein PhaeoP30_01608 [Phaeobacter inhibens]|nr:hypothetical protein PhaeoP30_01608 [Phaeobacter inhibens]
MLSLTATVVSLMFFAGVANARLDREQNFLTCESQTICNQNLQCEDTDGATVKFVATGQMGAENRKVYLIGKHTIVPVKELNAGSTLVWEDDNGSNLFRFNTEPFSDFPASSFFWAQHRIGPGGEISQHYSSTLIQGDCRWRGK